MDSVFLTISQALQLVALAPCIFVILFLLVTARNSGDNLLPVLYFASLSCSFILPLTGVFGPGGTIISGLLLLGQSLSPPLGFLLILQFLLGRVPPPGYWLILAVPVVGGSPFIYASLHSDEVCFAATECYATASLKTLYDVFSIALIFLLLIYKLSVSRLRVAGDSERAHKYWLIVALVIFNLLLGALGLMDVAGVLRAGDRQLAETVVRGAFIYLVLTSVFRVFYDLFDLQVASAGASPREVALAERLSALLEEERIYREMGLTRKAVAERLGIGEQQVSRLINSHFDKNFSELINGYRIREAQERLRAEESTVTVIAFEVGFNSIASFNRVFKELAGMSPTEFRGKRSIS